MSESESAKVEEVSSTSTVVLDQAFNSGAVSSVSDKLAWNHAPKSAEVVESGLRLHPNPATDYWRDTYYTPRLRADNAAFLHVTLESDFRIETSFTLHPELQFDQAGIMLRIDELTWLKTGIEHVDGKNRLSCVVTNTYSDWSTQDWLSNSVRIRVHRINTHDIAVEYLPEADGAEWTMIRIARLQRPKAELDAPVPLQAGVYVAAPNKAASDFFVDFHSLRIESGARDFHHTV